MELTSIIYCFILWCFRHLQNACIFRRTRYRLVSKPVSIFPGRPLIVIGFRHPPFLQGDSFPRYSSWDNIFPNTLFRFGAKILCTCFRGLSCFKPLWIGIMAKRDVIDQARLSAYFTEMSDDIFKEKLRRIVSIPILNSIDLILSLTYMFFNVSLS